ncbi:helix-turn-helix domain-containing protein [Pseudarthrobacter psychrotolerans]|uniref:Helix-turn-helix domain-containing protein n=1 Tax=Pseudarthrobacter psychrotolerans TaxID=2697569 RepID=A0A6P1NJJ3_9MICC|nr:helix-turn-helix domain-containing protein [Pseudarthrobacter psychrotolerans]QHK19508.1 helix-turn-helix domain-containing protein [Pseudarthrobacter psychrotolerans]
MTPTAVPAGAAQASPSQTLSRGIRALEILAAAQAPLTIAELAEAMGVHRSVAYRILRTLEDHSLLVRDDAGKVQPGPGLAVLARGVARNLQTAALPELTQLANALTMSAFVAVWDRDDCVTLVTVDPRHTGAAIVQHPGSRHPISAGAPGIAIQSAYSEADWHAAAPGTPYRPEAGTARRVGYAASHDEVIAGVSSVAVPVRVPGGRPAALAVVYIRAAQNPDEIAAALMAGAGRIEAQLG